jgi:hypothetical protein
LIATSSPPSDPALVFSAATAGLADLERFAAELSAWVEAQG